MFKKMCNISRDIEERTSELNSRVEKLRCFHQSYEKSDDAKTKEKYMEKMKE